MFFLLQKAHLVCQFRFCLSIYDYFFLFYFFLSNNIFFPRIDSKSSDDAFKLGISLEEEKNKKRKEKEKRYQMTEKKKINK